jgi:hypothetical protein
MFENEALIKIAEDVVSREEEQSHLEETGMELVHFDFEITKAEQPILYTGRGGDYYKFNFEYRLTSLDESGLDSPEDTIRKFRRSLRLNAEGKVSAIGDRVEIFD